MVVLLTSLSRQVLVTSSNLVDKIKATVLGEELRENGEVTIDLASAIAEMEKLGLGDPIASLDPVSNKLKTSIDDMPSLTGVEALVYHVDRLFELATKNERRINTVVNQVLNRKGNRHFVKSEMLSGSVYYLPHVNRESKLLDRQIMNDIASELEKSLTPQVELHERLIQHLVDRLSSNHDFPNPIGSELFNTISQIKRYISDHANPMRGLPEIGPDGRETFATSPPGFKNGPPIDDFVNLGVQSYFDKLKVDIDQYSDLLTVGMQLSFDPTTSHTGTAGEKLGELIRTTVREVIMAHLYSPLMSLFRSMNDTKDGEWADHCNKLKEVMTPNLIGLSTEFWDVVTAPGALADFFPICESFINADTVRMKYDYLNRMSTATQTIASNGLKRIAAAAGKPFDPSKHGDNLRFAVGADDFVPLFAYMLLQANIPDVHAQFAYLSVFTDENAMIGKYGYLLASLQTGMMVISGLDATKPPPSSAMAIEGFTVIGDTSDITPSPSPMSSLSSVAASRSFIRTSTSTANLAGTDPLSRDDWDSEGNISDEGDDLSNQLDDVSATSTPPMSVKKLKRDKRATLAVTTLLNGKLGGSPDDRTSYDRSSTSYNPSSDLGGGSLSKSMTDIDRSSPSLDSPIRSASSVLKEQQMPTIVKLNTSASSGLAVSFSSHLTGDHAYGLSLKLFTSMLLLYQRFANRLLAQSSTSVSSDNSIHNDEIFKNYQDEIMHLPRVQLSSMSDSQRLVFFLNVFHSLQMHAYLESHMPDSVQDRIHIMASFAYNIGDQTFSLLEIEHGILRHWSPYPKELLDGMFHFPAKWKTSDWPKSSCAPRRADPRINFILSPLASSGPPLHVFTVETLEFTLQSATEAFLRRNVLVSPDNSVIILPKQLYWYAREFGKRERNVIDWVSRYLEPSQQEILISTKKDSLRVKYNEYDWTFVFSFENGPER